LGWFFPFPNRGHKEKGEILGLTFYPINSTYKAKIPEIIAQNLSE
jgi:hypothetical protein